MQVIRAAEMGMCFGVRDALQIAERIEYPTEVTIHGELVHNQVVTAQLQTRGFVLQSESDRSQIPTTPNVLITAHGVSERERQRLLGSGKNLIDTTCPLVRRVHQAAQQLERDGYHVLVIGRPGHVEVRGIVEDLSSYDVLSSIQDVRTWPHPKLGVICQTTTPPRHAAEIEAEIEDRNPTAKVRFINTICQPTQNRQYAMELLCLEVDAVVVVGGGNSNNTRQLVELAREQGTPAFHVQTSADLRREWLAGCHVVGLTAGTSTLDETVDEVHRVLAEWPISRPEFSEASPASPAAE